eukprot:3074122-Pyramimonas_sp.AAC.1
MAISQMRKLLPISVQFDDVLLDQILQHVAFVLVLRETSHIVPARRPTHTRSCHGAGNLSVASSHISKPAAEGTGESSSGLGAEAGSFATALDGCQRFLNRAFCKLVGASASLSLSRERNLHLES